MSLAPAFLFCLFVVCYATTYPLFPNCLHAAPFELFFDTGVLGLVCFAIVLPPSHAAPFELCSLLACLVWCACAPCTLPLSNNVRYRRAWFGVFCNCVFPFVLFVVSPPGGMLGKSAVFLRYQSSDTWCDFTPLQYGDGLCFSISRVRCVVDFTLTLA